MEPQDSQVTSTGDNCRINFTPINGFDLSPCQGRKKKVKEIKKKGAKTKILSWTKPFHKMSSLFAVTNDISDLLNLLKLYKQNVTEDVLASYCKPTQCARLKANMAYVLGFFHVYFNSLPVVPIEKDEYYKKMSELTAMYLDMEIKASRRGKEAIQKVTSKLISSLFCFLNQDPEYIIDAILATRFMKRCFKEICIPIFKAVTKLPVEGDELNYVRFLLIFKLWKLVVHKEDERNTINRLATAKLSPPSPLTLNTIRRGVLSKVLPTLPADMPEQRPELMTRFYMTSQFKIRKAINAFVELVKTLKDNEFIFEYNKSRFRDLPIVIEDTPAPIISKTIIEVSKELKDSEVTIDLITPKPRKPVEVEESPITTKNETNKNLEKLWLTVTNSSSTSFGAKPSIYFKPSSQVDVPQQNVVSKANDFVGQIATFNMARKMKISRDSGNRINDEMVAIASCSTSNTNTNFTHQSSELFDVNTNHTNLESTALHSETNNNCFYPKEAPRLTLHYNDQDLILPMDFVTNKTSPDLLTEASDTVSSGSIHHETNLNHASPNFSSMKAKNNIGNFLKCNQSKQFESRSRPLETSSIFRILEAAQSKQVFLEEDVESSSEEYKDMSSGREDEDSSSEEDNTMSSKKDSRYYFNKYTNPKYMSQVFPLSLSDRGTRSGDTSNVLRCNQRALFSHKPYTHTEVVAEQGCRTTLPDTVASNTVLADEQDVCIVGEGEAHSILKSESTKRDCMFTESKPTSTKHDYSIDALLKVKQMQISPKNKDVAMDYCIIKDITNNHIINRGFGSDSKETPPDPNQQSSITRLGSKVEIYGPLNEDVLRCTDDPQTCTQERILTKASSVDSSFRVENDRFEKAIMLRHAQNTNSNNKCGQAKKRMSENIENNTLNKQILREEFQNPSFAQREPSIFKPWRSLSPSCVNQDSSNDSMRMGCKKLKTHTVMSACQNLEAQQILRALPDKIDVNNIELQVQAQHNIFAGDDDCESESSNLVIDEDLDSLKELNESNEDVRFVLKSTNGTIEKQCSIADLRNGNVRRSKSIHELPSDNMIHAQMIPEISVDVLNRSNPKIGLSDSIFLNSSATKSVISSCNNSERFYSHENRTFIPRSMYTQNNVNSNGSSEDGQSFSSQNAHESILTQGNVSKSPPVKQIENMSLNQRLINGQVEFQNFQIHRTEQPSSDLFISMQDSLHTLRNSPAPLSEGFNNVTLYTNGELGNYYNKLLLSNSNKPELNKLNEQSLSPNTTFHSINKLVQPCERPNCVVPDYHNSSVEYDPNEKHVVVYMQPNLDYLSSSELQNFSLNQGLIEKNDQISQQENVLNKSDSALDPLCLVVNNKDHTREIGIDFECFDIGQEIEVSSAADFCQSDLDMCGPNDVEESGSPMSVEHSVSDTPVPVPSSQEPDQFLHSPNISTNLDQSSSLYSELQQVLGDLRYPSIVVSKSKDKLNLHAKTLEVDHELCRSQYKFKEFNLSQDVSPAIPVPFPPQNRCDKSPVRCVCELCSNNYNKLLNNYKVLTNIKNSKVKPLIVYPKEKPTYEKDQTTETDCNLPLKKRKTLTSLKNSEETKLTSYPNTPMISIAQLELTRDKPQNQIILSKSNVKSAPSPKCPPVSQKQILLEQLKDDEPLCTRRRSTRRRKSTR